MNPSFPFPTRGVAPHEILRRKVLQDVDGRMLAGVPRAVVDVVCALCARDPAARPTAAEVATSLASVAQEVPRG